MTTARGLVHAAALLLPPAPAAEDARPLALRCAKAVTCAPHEPVVDRALVLVRDGVVEAVVRDGGEAPDGYELVDAGDAWVVPGFVDLHCHVGGTFDINDMVYQANPGLRVSTAVVPGNPMLRRAVAAGVTTVLFIPGSGTAIGGQGVLLKTGLERYEEMVVRDPGSLKVAQGNNPKSYAVGSGSALYNHHIRAVGRRGVEYARAWERHERGEGPEPERDLSLDVFRDLAAGRAQVSTHTQQASVVSSTLRIQVRELGLPTFIDHGTFDGFRTAAEAEALGVPAILGPRSISSRSRGRGIDHDGRIEGVAAGYQARGHTRIGFNTDAPVIPQEELQLQAAMGVRYGLDDSALAAVRGLTCVPAEAAGIADRVGSLEPGKDADLVVIAGHPADPRNRVELVLIEGRVVYDASEERLW